jgi:uncharacterized membrane protein
MYSYYSNAAIIIAIALNVLALIYKFFQPKKINTLYGYHMRSSMRNLETWREANHYAANIMLALSLFFLAAALITSHFVVPFSARELAVFAGVVIVSVAGTYFLTEQHMKNMFDEQGNRRK